MNYGASWWHRKESEALAERLAAEDQRTAVVDEPSPESVDGSGPPLPKRTGRKSSSPPADDAASALLDKDKTSHDVRALTVMQELL